MSASAGCGHNMGRNAAIKHDYGSPLRRAGGAEDNYSDFRSVTQVRNRRSAWDHLSFRYSTRFFQHQHSAGAVTFQKIARPLPLRAVVTSQAFLLRSVDPSGMVAYCALGDQMVRNKRDRRARHFA